MGLTGSRLRARYISLSLAIGGFFWALLYFSTPDIPRDYLPDFEDEFPRHHRPPPRPYPILPQTKASVHWQKRAEAVKEAFLHAYRGYKEHAWGHDELLPLSDSYVDNFNGWGVTLIDALDTMWIMDLHDEFHDAIPFIANMTFAHDERENFVPFFETVIRYLGGLLSAYALSGEPILLARADDLGKALLPAFNTSSGMPMYAVDTVTGETRHGWLGPIVLWSEALSCQVEYKYLAHLTGRAQYFHTVERIMDIMHDANITDGRFPTRWTILNAAPANEQFSVGAFADSAHEYLLKQWLLTSKSEPKALELYLKAVRAILTHLLYLTPTRHLLYVTDSTPTHVSHTFEHLSCFLPGLLALGASTSALPEHERELHMWAARGLGRTCWVMYRDHGSGLGPDEVVMDSWPSDEGEEGEGRWMRHVERWKKEGRPGGVPPGVLGMGMGKDHDEREEEPREAGEREYSVRSGGYLLRPETVESFYYLYRTTGDERWRERGWAVFEAIERETRTTSGYASVRSVEVSNSNSNSNSPDNSNKKDEMPSFFMAETLKYLYLLFTADDPVPLDRWVFNTEAHPLPVFEWSGWEKERYGIPVSKA